MTLIPGGLGAQAATLKAVFPPGANPIGPYSPGIVAGDYLYVSGQGAKRADGTFPSDAAAQTRECLDKIKTIVAEAGFQMAGIVYSQVYVRDAAAFPEVERAWAEYFPNNGPARSMIGVANLPDNTPVEVNAVVVRDPATKKSVLRAGAISARRRYRMPCSPPTAPTFQTAAARVRAIFQAK